MRDLRFCHVWRVILIVLFAVIFHKNVQGAAVSPSHFYPSFGSWKVVGNEDWKGFDSPENISPLYLTSECDGIPLEKNVTFGLRDLTAPFESCRPTKFNVSGMCGPSVDCLKSGRTGFSRTDMHFGIELPARHHLVIQRLKNGQMQLSGNGDSLGRRIADVSQTDVNRNVDARTRYIAALHVR